MLIDKKYIHIDCSSILDLILSQKIQNDYCQDLLSSIIGAIEKNVLQSVLKISILERLKNFVNFLCYYHHFDLDGPKEKYDIIFWPVQIMHIEYMMPVYMELTQLGIKSAFICSRGDIIDLIQKEKASLIIINEKHKLKLTIKGLLRTLNILRILIKFHQLKKKHFGINIYVEKSLDHFYYFENYSAIFEQCVRLYQPKYHLLGYDLSVVCRTININARKRNIPTGHIQHGAINSNLIKFSICDQQFLWDDLTYNLLKIINYPKELYIIGSTRVQQYLKAGMHKNAVQEHLYGHSGPILLICFSGPGHSVTEKGHVENIKVLKKFTFEFPSYKYIIKLHPKDKKRYYEEFSRTKNVLLVDDQHTLYEQPINSFISVATITVTGGSVVAIESLIQQKPVISLDILNELQNIDFLNSEMIFRCNDYSSFKDAVNSILNNNDNFIVKKKLIADYSNNYFLTNKENPALKIAKIIRNKLIDTESAGIN